MHSALWSRWTIPSVSCKAKRTNRRRSVIKDPAMQPATWRCTYRGDNHSDSLSGCQWVEELVPGQRKFLLTTTPRRKKQDKNLSDHEGAKKSTAILSPAISPSISAESAACRVRAGYSHLYGCTPCIKSYSHPARAEFSRQSCSAAQQQPLPPPAVLQDRRLPRDLRDQTRRR